MASEDIDWLLTWGKKMLDYQRELKIVTETEIQDDEPDDEREEEE